MIPASFTRDGFALPTQLRKGKFRRLLVGTEGWSDSGKTEFALSAPGPGLVLCLDRGYEAVLDNQHPPKTRRDDFAFKVIQVPLETQMKQPDFLKYWQEFYRSYLDAVNNPDARTIVLDGDSDSWELQRLAEFGTLTGILPLQYTKVKAARRAMIARAFDSGKIVIMTNKLKKEYKKQIVNNKEVDVETGGTVRQGFPDQDYLQQLQIRHMYKDGKWGILITKCKVDKSLEGLDLWGDDCNFQSLLSVVYPDVDLKEWGY